MLASPQVVRAPRTRAGLVRLLAAGLAAATLGACATYDAGYGYDDGVDYGAVPYGVPYGPSPYGVAPPTPYYGGYSYDPWAGPYYGPGAVYAPGAIYYGGRYRDHRDDRRYDHGRGGSGGNAGGGAVRPSPPPAAGVPVPGSNPNPNMWPGVGVPSGARPAPNSPLFPGVRGSPGSWSSYTRTRPQAAVPSPRAAAPAVAPRAPAPAVAPAPAAPRPSVSARGTGNLWPGVGVPSGAGTPSAGGGGGHAAPSAGSGSGGLWIRQ